MTLTARTDGRRVSRATVFELAADLGVELREANLGRYEGLQADEIFFTGTTTEVRPTVRLDGEPVGDGKVGPVAKSLCEAFKAGTHG